MFKPKSVAMVGASATPGKIGHVILQGLMKGFEGRVYPVNPHEEEILGLKCYPKVAAIPKQVDLAVIAVPAKLVPQVMRDCGKKGMRGAIIISGGFSEIGNKALEDEVRRIANKNKIAVIGPNCLGVYDSYSKMDTLFNPRYKMERPREGGISFISQSGAVGAVVMDWAGAEGFGFSKFISYGNALNIDEVDLLDYLGKDPSTKVICMYLEGTRRGKDFIKAAKRVSLKKPIIGLKAGKSDEGAKAVASHTGSLAGTARVWEAAFRQAGVVEARSMPEVFNYARAFAEQPLPKGGRVGIITNGGGFGVLATDACIENGLEVPPLAKKTAQEIRKKVPSYATVKNPIDLVGDSDYLRYEAAINALLKDKSIDSILCIVLFQTADIDSRVISVISEASDLAKKPIVCCAAGGEYSRLHSQLLEEAGVPTFSSLKAAADTLAAITYYDEFRKSVRK
ncbi:MAG: CoA-binding protein [Candidatus Diapherotrites archaeon]|nr:CoA-binding protein [Candidatus Diapherotrites archaeon]